MSVNVVAACRDGLPYCVSASHVVWFGRKAHLFDDRCGRREAQKAKISVHCGPQNENLGANSIKVIQNLKKSYLLIFGVPGPMVTPAGIQP